MVLLFLTGFILFFIGYFGLDEVNKSSPALSSGEIVLAIIFLLGIICLTVSITLFISF